MSLALYIMSPAISMRRMRTCIMCVCVCVCECVCACVCVCVCVHNSMH
jgi:hypothetical protein